MIADGISLSFNIIFIFPILMYGLTRDSWWLWFFGMLMLCIVGVEIIKHYLGKDFGRPPNAEKCDLFCQEGRVGGQPAFPSGHMATTTTFVVLLWLHFRRTYILWLGIPWIGAMAWSRWSKQCHSIDQIIAGVITGSVFSYIMH